MVTAYTFSDFSLLLQHTEITTLHIYYELCFIISENITIQNAQNTVTLPVRKFKFGNLRSFVKAKRTLIAGPHLKNCMKNKCQSYLQIEHTEFRSIKHILKTQLM